MKSILDPTFRYRSSVDTDLRRTFARIRRELKLPAPGTPRRARASQVEAPRPTVVPLRPRLAQS